LPQAFITSGPIRHFSSNPLAHFKIHWRFSKSVVVLIYFGYTVTGPNSLNTKTIYPIENYCEEL
jgi:hypothetical protein